MTKSTKKPISKDDFAHLCGAPWCDLDLKKFDATKLGKIAKAKPREKKQ